MTTVQCFASHQLGDTDTSRIFLSVLLGEESPCCKYQGSDWHCDCKVDPKIRGHSPVAFSLPVEERHAEERLTRSLLVQACNMREIDLHMRMLQVER